MEILIVGGTRFFGIPMTRSLIEKGHSITLATRSGAQVFGGAVKYISADRLDRQSVKSALGGRHFDVIIDKVAYASEDVRTLLSEVSCGRYIQMSSCAVYSEQRLNIPEDAFRTADFPLEWRGRTPDYAGGKRLAERAALEFMEEENCTFVRYPVVLGENDYTGRLKFYSEHIKSGTPFYADCLTAGTSYIGEEEAGEFIAFLAENPVSGAVNGCSGGILSQGEIIDRIEKLTGRKAVLSPEGDPAPYNGILNDVSYSTEKAEAAGYRFSELSSWANDLIKKITEL